jgi:FAD/FMN-containing dehydrogenase
LGQFRKNVLGAGKDDSMKRREFLKAAVATPLVPGSELLQLAAAREDKDHSSSRVRPGDATWPSQESWNRLNRLVEGRLIKVESPLSLCREAPDSRPSQEVFRALRNPYYVGDHPGLTQTSGWVDAWTSLPSAYAVAARKTEDVVAAVNFARENRLRLVVKGGGHSYQGTSCAPDSLLVWTREMRAISLHEAFVGKGCEGAQHPLPAVSIGAGARWLEAYEAVTTRAGRYVQGGGCTTVGVAGLIQSGGFGSFSKNYGLAAAALLEAEVVTADGVVRIANAGTNPDLFWGLKGGGGGSLGVVTRVTLRTRELPQFFGAVAGKITATSDTAFRELIARAIGFYADRLFNPHWGEQMRFQPGNKLEIAMLFQGLNQTQAEEVWKPFREWLAASKHDFKVEAPLRIAAIPARLLWNATVLKKFAPDVVVTDDRPNSAPGNFFWAGDRDQVGWVLYAYRSAWLPASWLQEKSRPRLVEALFRSARHWSMSLHFNKGLAGAPAEEIAAARDTAMNPAVLDAFALAISGGGGPPAFPGIKGHEPDHQAARRAAAAVAASMGELLKGVTDPGSYVSESDFFEPRWQQSYWGANYPRLAAVKKKYDPNGLFIVHNGVGSEEWSADGFTRISSR